MPKKKSKRRPIPYAKIQKMLAAGKTYKEIAISLDRFDEKSADPTKPIRGIVCRMKKHGYKDSKGKTVKLKSGKVSVTKEYIGENRPNRKNIPTMESSTVRQLEPSLNRD